MICYSPGCSIKLSLEPLTRTRSSRVPKLISSIFPKFTRRSNSVASSDGSETFILTGTSPKEIWISFAGRAETWIDFQAIVAEFDQALPDGHWRQTVDDLIKNEGLDQTKVWALMLSWLAKKLSDLRPSRQFQRLLRRALSKIDDTRQEALMIQLDRRFPNLKAENWN
jgi:hypothetical protein